MLKPAKNLILFSGNANNVLAGKIAKKLGKNLGKAEVERFSDGESDAVSYTHLTLPTTNRV